MISGIDQLVFTVAAIDATCAVYRDCLGMAVEHFGPGRTALRCGAQRINLHQRGREFSLRPSTPAPGSQDVCLAARGVPVEEGPVARTGAAGPMTSLDVRDPDGNLIARASHG